MRHKGSLGDLLPSVENEGGSKTVVWLWVGYIYAIRIRDRQTTAEPSDEAWVKTALAGSPTDSHENLFLICIAIPSRVRNHERLFLGTSIGREDMVGFRGCS